MREKIFKILNKTYGLLLLISFFAGFLPIIPFVIAIIVGGPVAESICLFLYDSYYPWVIAFASISVVIGLVAMYLGKLQGFSIKKNKKQENKISEQAETEEKQETESHKREQNVN